MGLKKFFKKIEKQTRVNLKHLPNAIFGLGAVATVSGAQSFGQQLGSNLAGALSEMTQKTEQKQQGK